VDASITSVRSVGGLVDERCNIPHEPRITNERTNDHVVIFTHRRDLRLPRSCSCFTFVLFHYILFIRAYRTLSIQDLYAAHTHTHTHSSLTRRKIRVIFTSILLGRRIFTNIKAQSHEFSFNGLQPFPFSFLRVRVTVTGNNTVTVVEGAGSTQWRCRRFRPAAVHDASVYEGRHDRLATGTLGRPTYTIHAAFQHRLP